jgi:S-formylglutathione hydrolase FrmB
MCVIRATGEGIVCERATAEESSRFARRESGETLEYLPRPDKGRRDGLTIQLRATAQLAGNPKARDAFVRAVTRWEEVVDTPITVTLDVDFGPTRFGVPYPSPLIIGAHWKDDALGGQYQGVMDPTINAGVREEITDLDLRALDVLGYRVDGEVDAPTLDVRVQRIRHFSAALGVEKAFNIYVPPEASDPGRRFPALYLFRGHEDEWINKNQDATRGGTNVVDVYLDLRSQGLVEPMILVFPGLTNATGAIHSAGINMRASGNVASLGTGRFEDYLVEDLIPYVDANFPTIASKAGRGLDGFSLGGFVSMNLALRHPDLFATAGAFDGLYLLAKNGKPAKVAKTDPFYNHAIFDAAFGLPRDVAFVSANNPLTAIADVAPEAVQSIRWLLEFGPKALEPNVNFVRGKRMVKAIRAKGGENLMGGVVAGSAHTWNSADEHMRRSLPIHGRELGP